MNCYRRLTLSLGVALASFIAFLGVGFTTVAAAGSPPSGGRVPYVSSTPLPDLNRWSVMPAPNSNSRSSSWIVATVSRHSVYHTGVALLNYTRRPLHLVLWVADASTRGGGFVTTNIGARVKGIGAWAHLIGRTSVVVPPLRYMVVPLDIHVPRYTAGGLYAGGFEARSDFAPMASTGGVRYNVAQQVGVRIKLTVPGKDKVLPIWSGLSCVLDARQDASCSIRLTNDGTVALSAHGYVMLTPYLAGLSTRVPVPAIEELLPESFQELKTAPHHAPPGLYRVTAYVQANGRAQRLDAILVVPPPVWSTAGLIGVFGVVGWPRSRRFLARIIGGALRGAIQGMRGSAA